MSSRGRRVFVKGMAMLLSVSMAAPLAGCNTQSGPGTSATESISQEEEESREQTPSQTQEPAQPEATPEAPRAKIDDNGKPIWDFDEFVNAQWKQEQEAKDDIKYYYFANTVQKDDLYAKYKDILDNTDLSALSEEDGLYKAITLYREYLRQDDDEERFAAMKKRLAKVDKVKNLNGLYEIYCDKEFFRMDGLFNCKLSSDNVGYNSMWYMPECWVDSANTALGGALSSDLSDERGQVILKNFAKLGYSEKRAKEILKNAIVLELEISKFLQESSSSSLFYYMYHDQLDEREIKAPLVTILTQDEDAWFLAKLECLDFWKKLFVEENFTLLRDHLLCCMIIKDLWKIGDEDLQAIWDYRSVYDDYSDIAYNAIWGPCKDVINEEYIRRYMDQETISDIEEMVEEVKLYERSIIADSTWLSTHGKELARRKILRLGICIARNDNQYDLSDLQLTDNLMENLYALKLGYNDFERSQMQYTCPDIKTFDYDMSEVNAFYNAPLNDIILLTGFLCSPHCSKDVAFEERLAYLGETVAHEISHAYDPNGSNYDEEGWFSPWMTEKEATAYQERVDKIAAFFDGMEVEYGLTLDGDRVKAESFADLMAMECYLRILADKEDADYDLFFRSYARYTAVYYTEDGMKEIVKNDTHLPGKQRINYILGQFDKFYETYEIDENSPYFVPVEKRLPVL